MSLEDVPIWLSDTWSITLESAQTILSIVVIFGLVLPVMYLSKGKRSVTIEIATFLLAEAFLIGIGWLPYWLMIATVAIMAVPIALMGSRAVTGD